MSITKTVKMNNQEKKELDVQRRVALTRMTTLLWMVRMKGKAGKPQILVGSAVLAPLTGGQNLVGRRLLIGFHGILLVR
jgi:hypothetical protein